jgi:hypothetical protein
MNIEFLAFAGLGAAVTAYLYSFASKMPAVETNYDDMAKFIQQQVWTTMKPTHYNPNYTKNDSYYNVYKRMTNSKDNNN